MTLRTLPARFAGLLAGCIVAALIAIPAQAGARYGDTHVTIHESIQVKGSAAAIWARIGGFCDITGWVPPIASCTYEKGGGEEGSVRRLSIDGIGDVVEVMSERTATGYTYIMIEGFLVEAEYRSTIWTVPGPTASTAEVHWLTTIKRAAFPDGGVGISGALVGLYRLGLETIKAQVE